MGLLKGLLGSIPDNAFQKITAGKEWDLNQRFASVVVGGLKLAGVGFVSSIGAWSVSNGIYAVRRVLNPTIPVNNRKSVTLLLKSAVVYGSYLGTSANLRYQVHNGFLFNIFFFFPFRYHYNTVCTMESLISQND